MGIRYNNEVTWESSKIEIILIYMIEGVTKITTREIFWI